MRKKYAINANCIGLDMGEYVVEITPRMTLAYAAAIGALEDVYFDDARPEGIIAPPPMIVVIEFPLMMATKYLHGIGLTKETISEYILHAFQDTRFYDVIRPGDNLRVTGKIVQLKQTSAGALVVCCIQTKKDDSGRLVAESWFGSLFSGLKIEGEPETIYAPPALGKEAGLEGDGIKQSTYQISRALPHIYTECANIWNPIHTERKHALQRGLPDIILHGTCTWAYACMTIIREYANGDPSRIKRCGARFSRMVIPGSHIIVEHRTAAGKEGFINFDVRNGTGELALSHGAAEIE